MPIYDYNPESYNYPACQVLTGKQYFHRIGFVFFRACFIKLGQKQFPGTDKLFKDMKPDGVFMEAICWDRSIFPMVCPQLLLLQWATVITYRSCYQRQELE